MIRIVVADDHPVFRAGMAAVLESEEHFHVVHQAASGAELLAFLDREDADVACIDINMPGLSGLELLPEIKRRRPKLPVLVLSHHSEQQMAVRAIRAGADGYLNKDAPPADLINAMERLSLGKKYFSPDVAELLADRVHAPAERPHDRLSNRELRVFSLLAAGESVNAIGERLNLSPKTVSTYRARVLEKLGLRSNADMVRYALENNLSTEN